MTQEPLRDATPPGDIIRGTVVAMGQIQRRIHMARKRGKLHLL